MIAFHSVFSNQYANTLVLKKIVSQQHILSSYYFLPRDLKPGVTLGVVEEAGRLGVRNLWLQPGSENDEVCGRLGQHPKPSPVTTVGV